MQAAVNRLEAVAARLEALSVTAKITESGGEAGVCDEMVPFVVAFDGILSGSFGKYLELSAKIGGDVNTQAGMVKAAFQALRDFLLIVSRSKKPSQNVLMDLLKPISQQIAAVQEFREKNRTSAQFNHLSGISESIPALGWVTVEPTPGPYVKEMSDAGMFYTNRVLKDYKEKDQSHVDWTKAWLGTLRELIDYIKAYHTTGVAWNSQGGNASAAAASKPPTSKGGAPPPPPPPAGGPPPPPPCPPAPPASGEADSSDVRAALFSELNRGEVVTAGLKKVTDDMKTHKNPALKAKSAVPGVRTGPAPFKAAGPPKIAQKPHNTVKPPVFELQQKKWVIENQVGNKSLVIEETNLKQTVYMYKCTDSTLVIKGKCNSIVVDSCKKVAVAFDAVVSSVEFINCQSVQGQVLSGKCPTVSIEKTDGCMMYLCKESLDAEVVTSKSSEMNILVPKDDGDFAEFALPEQFKSTFDGKKFKTDLTESV